MLKWIKLLRDIIIGTLQFITFAKKEKRKNDLSKASEETFKTRDQKPIEGSLSNNPGEPTRHEYDKLRTRTVKKGSGDMVS